MVFPYRLIHWGCVPGAPCRVVLSPKCPSQSAGRIIRSSRSSSSIPWGSFQADRTSASAGTGLIIFTHPSPGDLLQEALGFPTILAATDSKTLPPSQHNSIDRGTER